jgi:glycosyltransferase involved in cell wall biosynthesis
VIVSDIPANKEVELPPERYFRCGNVDDLKEKMEVLLGEGLSEEERQEILNQIEEKYNWDRIAEQTIGVFMKVFKQRAESKGLNRKRIEELGEEAIEFHAERTS